MKVVIELEADELQSLLMSIAIMSATANKGVVAKPFTRFVDLFENMCKRHGDNAVDTMMAIKTTSAISKLINEFDKECEKRGLFEV